MEIPFQAAIIEALHQSDAWSLVLEWLENAYNQHEMGYRTMSRHPKTVGGDDGSNFQWQTYLNYGVSTLECSAKSDEIPENPSGVHDFPILVKKKKRQIKV